MDGLIVTVVEEGAILVNLPCRGVRQGVELAIGVSPNLRWLAQLLGLFKGKLGPGSCSDIGSLGFISKHIVHNS